MAACFRVDMCQQGAFNSNGNIPLPGSTPSRSGGGDGASNIVDGGDKVSVVSPPQATNDEAVAGENAARNMFSNGSNGFEAAPQPPPPGEMSRQFAADVSPECHLLLNAMQR